jgi:plastocyanin
MRRDMVLAMKRSIIIMVTAGLIVSAAVVITTNRLASGYLTSVASAASSGPQKCPTVGANYRVAVKNNRMIPAHVEGRVCDTLTFTNADSTLRMIAFGPHDNHVPYDGVAEKVLSTNQSFTITLNQAGTYTFHDHIDDVATGSFTVNK